MISDNTIRSFMNAVFINPQRILGGLEGERKLDSVHLIFVKLLSGEPLKGRGTKLDSLSLKIGFSNIDKELEDIEKSELDRLCRSLSRFDKVIGSWTLVHDIAATKKHPLWRLSAEICPANVQNVSIERTEEDNRKILCIDCEGVGVFMGNPKKE